MWLETRLREIRTFKSELSQLIGFGRQHASLPETLPAVPASDMGRSSLFVDERETAEPVRGTAAIWFASAD